MNAEYVKGTDLARMLKAGCINLERHKDRVNTLNVFPVPDGDTGTNMYLTLMAAAREVDKENASSVDKVAKAMARGSLMGARGNSGVILSQVFRGMARYLENKKQANPVELAQSIQAGADTAYRAVMKPVEGTILTVVREVARAAIDESRRGAGVAQTLQAALKHGNQVLARTPQMLPILNEAGVVDAGGQGFLFFLEGALEAWAADKDIALEKGEPEPAGSPVQAEGDIVLDFRYCTEVLIRGEHLDTSIITQRLKDRGDSLLVVGDREMVKVHIHSNHPGLVLETCLEFGSLHDIKINNMLEEALQRHERLATGLEPMVDAAATQPEPKNIGVVAVGVGQGIISILESLGVDQVVEGGQTMNPSTEDLAKACRMVKADQVIILPNNSNVIMTAEQVKYLCDKRVEVVPSQDIMHGIAALVAFDPNEELPVVLQAMTEEMTRVKSAEVTYAVRDTVINGLEIHKGDIIGLVNGEVVVASDSVDEVVDKMLRDMVSEEDELITLIYGQEVAGEDAEKLKSRLEQEYPACDVEMHYGGQPHYHYLLAVE